MIVPIIFIAIGFVSISFLVSFYRRFACPSCNESKAVTARRSVEPDCKCCGEKMQMQARRRPSAVS